MLILPSRFVGAIVRKQLFVQIYAYFIYIHFLLNIGVAAYLLYLVTHFSADANVVACQKAIKNQKAKDQCTGLLKVAQGVYFVIAAFVLLVELCEPAFHPSIWFSNDVVDGTLVVTRYLNQVKNEKRTARASRMINEEAFALVSKGKGRSSSVPAVGQPYTFSDYAVEEFDPYNIDTRPTAGSRQSFAYDGVPTHPDEVGYGGGSWTHREITEEEKARLKREEGEDAVPEPITLDDEERERQRQDIKSSMGPPSISNPRELDDLPRYTLSDPPRGSGLV